MSTTASPAEGSKYPSPLSAHSKLLLVDTDTVTTMSCVSFPVMTRGCANAAVTTQEPCGIGEVAKMGLGTVVAPAGAWPSVVKLKPETDVSKPQ